MKAAHARLYAKHEGMLADLKAGGLPATDLDSLRARSPALVPTDQLGSYADGTPVAPDGKKERFSKAAGHWWSHAMGIRLKQRAK